MTRGKGSKNLSERKWEGTRQAVIVSSFDRSSKQAQQDNSRFSSSELSVCDSSELGGVCGIPTSGNSTRPSKPSPGIHKAQNPYYRTHTARGRSISCAPERAVAAVRAMSGGEPERCQSHGQVARKETGRRDPRSPTASEISGSRRWRKSSPQLELIVASSIHTPSHTSLQPSPSYHVTLLRPLLRRRRRSRSTSRLGHRAQVR